MSFCQTIDLVVVDEKCHINIASNCSKKMVSSLAIAAAIAACNDHRQIRVRELRTGGHWKRSSVQAVENIGIKIVWCLGCLADTRYKQYPVWVKIAFDERFLERLEDWKIPTAGTPGCLEFSVIFCANPSSVDLSYDLNQLLKFPNDIIRSER